MKKSFAAALYYGSLLFFVIALVGLALTALGNHLSRQPGTVLATCLIALWTLCVHVAYWVGEPE